ncbi:MAG: DUF4390 domain-containing protein [Desulfobacterales bacterium]|nr:DUF4390 domain-containing protein [Desulfobacterales bacterium]
MRSKSTWILLIFILLLNLVVPYNILADTNAVLANIKLANTRDDLLTYFDVRNAFSDKISQAVQNGVPTTFSFYVSLYKTSDAWFDKRIADVQVRSTIKYNSLKKEYTVTRPWKDEKPAVTASFDQAKSWMTEIDNLSVIPLDGLVKGEKYQIRIKAELDKVTLPLFLHHVFFFVSFWDFETDWYLVNFTY